MEQIFHSLQEGIITIDISGINFLNGHGKNILKDIQNHKIGPKEIQNQIIFRDESSNTLQAKYKT